ncbi:MAG: HAD hydrolase-like protein [Patescibacteria group bacterium]
MEQSKKLVLFDFDGVLIDTLMVCYGINTFVNEDLSLEEYKGFFDGNIHDAKRTNGKAKEGHPNFHEEYRNKTRELVIPQVLKDSVKFLASKYTLVIVSSTPTISIKKILEREGLEDCFKDVLGADVHASKVIKINSMLEKYKINSVDALFITDTLGDIREAFSCGVVSIGVTWGFQERETLAKGNPKIILENPEDLTKGVESILC